MNHRRALIVTALMLAVAGLGIGVFAPTQQAGEAIKVAAAADLFQPLARPAASATASPENILIECPADAHVGVVDLPPGWFNLFVGNYHWKDIVIKSNPATKRIEVSCVYKDNFSMTRAVSLDYSCARVDPGNAFSPQVRCDLQPAKLPRKRKP